MADAKESSVSSYAHLHMSAYDRSRTPHTLMASSSHCKFPPLPPAPSLPLQLRIPKTQTYDATMRVPLSITPYRQKKKSLPQTFHTSKFKSRTHRQPDPHGA